MKFLDKLKRGLIKYFYGRYGVDQLTYFILLVSIVLTYFKYTWILSYVLMGYAVFRTLSKNIIKRRIEGAWFNKNIWFKIKGFFKRISIRFKQRKEYLYFKCNSCKKTLRVPRNKGKIKITCPQCKKTIVKKT